MRSDWLIPLCTGGERLKDADGRKVASDPEARGAAGAHPARRDQARRRRARPLLRHRHHRRRGQEARPPLHRHRARGGLYRARPRARIAAVPPGGRRGARRCRPRSAPSRASPSRSVVERGADRARRGAVDERRRHRARCGPTARSMLGDIVGSIHKIGALAQGLPACNGWTFWHYRDGRRLAPIDALRAVLRRELAAAEG